MYIWQQTGNTHNYFKDILMQVSHVQQCFTRASNDFMCHVLIQNCIGRFILALFDFVSRATVVAQASVRPSVNSGFREPAAQIQAKFCGQLPIHHISRHFFFQNLQFSNFYDFFFSFPLTWDPMRAKISKDYSSYIFHLIWANFMIISQSWGE